jgi:hypothetical protein
MRISAQTRLRRALNRHDIPLYIQHEVFNATFAPRSELLTTLSNESSFDGLLSDARNAKRAILSNKSKWPDELAVPYTRYIDCIQDVIGAVDSARRALLKNPDDPDGPRIPASLSRITEIAAKRVKKAQANGEPTPPLCNAGWPSWVDPTLRQSIIDEFDRAYTLMGRGRGRRFIPFATTSIIKDMDRAIIRHRKFIDDQRAVVADRPNTTGSTHYRALHLCALRMAEMWLDTHEREIKARTRNPATHPVPVNWMHMLTKDMRERIRAADENPADINPMGLTSFFNPEE